MRSTYCCLRRPKTMVLSKRIVLRLMLKWMLDCVLKQQLFTANRIRKGFFGLFKVDQRNSTFSLRVTYTVTRTWMKSRAISGGFKFDAG